MMLPTTADARKILLFAAAILSLVAAMLHTEVMPAHFREWWGYGLFFMVLALAQAFYSVPLMCRPNRSVLAVGIFGNLGVVALYLVTRTVGIPFFGLHAWQAGGIGAMDLASNIVEMALVFTLIALLWSWREPSRGAGKAARTVRRRAEGQGVGLSQSAAEAA